MNYLLLSRHYSIPIILLFSLLIGWQGLAQTAVAVNGIKFKSATIIARDLNESAGWYRKNMRFKVVEFKHEIHVKMQSGDMQLMILQGKNTVLFSQFKLPKDKKYVHGYDKFGFHTNKLDTLYQYYVRSELNMKFGIQMDQDLGQRYFTVLDPDGNKIILYEEKNDAKDITFSPFFFSIISSDYQHTIRWYEEHLGFKKLESKNKDAASPRNLLQSGNVVLEVQHMPFESLEPTEFMPIDRDLASFDAFKFTIGLGKKSEFELDNNGNKVQLLR